MANVKITDLPVLTGANSASTDVLPVVDVSADTTSKMTRAEFFQNVPSPTFTGQVSFPDGTAAAPSITHTGDLNAGIFFPAADTVAVSTNGAERMRVDSSGRVGIGTTSPTFIVQAALSSATDNKGIGLTETSYTTNFRANYLTLYGLSATGTTFGLSNANLGILTFQNLSAGLIGTNGAAPLVFATTATERMRVASNGNVGIGTTAPAYALEAAGSSKSIAVTGTGNPAFYAVTSDAAGIPFITLQNATASWQNRNNGATGDLSWAVSGSERMRITLGGNLIVGNGDTSATPISSTLRTTNGSGTDIAGASLTIQGGRGTGTGAGGSLLFSTAAAGTTGSSLNAATERMRIDASGNVGIGTTSPNAASIVDAQSTTKGVRFPNMTTTQKNAIANVAGNVVFDTTLGKLCVNSGSGWQTITSV